MFRMPLEAFTQDESFPFFIQYGKHETPLFLHGHDAYSELVIVLSGHATHIVDNEKFPIQKGDVFIVGEDTEHGYAAPENFHICNIMFRRNFLNLSETDIAESAGFQALFILEPKYSRSNHFTSHLKLSAQHFLLVCELLEQMHQEYYQKSAGWKTMIQADFLKLAVLLSRLYDTEKISTGTGILKLAPALAYIEKHYDHSLAVTELAAMTGYSERQFIRLFKEATGSLPLQYITEIRLRTARELLKNSDFSVTEIAGRCGYADSNYFSKLFHRRYGITPVRFRKNTS